MKKRRVCLRALCEEHSPIPAQKSGKVGSTVWSSREGIQHQRVPPQSFHPVPITSCWRGQGPLKECYLLTLGTLSFSADLEDQRCFIKWVPEAFPWGQGTPLLSALPGVTSHGNTLGQARMRSSERSSSQKSSLLTHLVGFAGMHPGLLPRNPSEADFLCAERSPERLKLVHFLM